MKMDDISGALSCNKPNRPEYFILFYFYFSLFSAEYLLSYPPPPSSSLLFRSSSTPFPFESKIITHSSFERDPIDAGLEETFDPGQDFLLSLRTVHEALLHTKHTRTHTHTKAEREKGREREGMLSKDQRRIGQFISPTE